MQKKQTILVVASLLVVILSVTLAYFTAQIIGKGKNINVKSNNLQILFDHSDGNITGTDITPGWSSTKKFTITNKSNGTYKYNIVIQNLVNTFVTEGYLQYKITSTNGGFSTDGYVDVPKSETATDTILGSANIEVGVTQTYTVEFIYKNDEDVDQSDDMGKVLSGTIFIAEKEEELLTLYDKILEDNPTRSTRSNFNNGTNDFETPLTATTTGTLFTSTESITGITDLPKEVYYYAGNTTNNWVKFGIYQTDDPYYDRWSAGDDIYWRIIRTNHDSSIRLLYVGASHDTTSSNIEQIEFNTSSDSPKYVGYKYGEDTSLDTIRNNTTDSTIKEVIDTWYQNYLTNYTKYLSTSAVYCNDRNLASGATYSTSSDFIYASYNRLSTNKAPTYNCTDIRDAFSVDNTSAKLNYPVALMTADEIIFAGGTAWYARMSTPYAWFISNSVGTQASSEWWSLSPIYWDPNGARIFKWLSDNLSETVVDGGGDVRPVISLKSCVKTSGGNGTSSNPYTIQETTSGC